MQQSPVSITDDLIAEITSRVSQDKRVRLTLPGGGKLHLDRRLPFLCVYRRPATRNDPGTEQLISAEAASLAIPDDSRLLKGYRRLVRVLLENLSSYFGALLIVEIWAEPEFSSADTVLPDTGESVPPKPLFEIVAGKYPQSKETIHTLARALGRIRIAGQPAAADIKTGGTPFPADARPIVPAGDARRFGCYLVGLEVRPVYRDPATLEIFPRVMRTLRRGLGYALRRAFFAFARQHTRINPQHYYSLGRRSVLKKVWEVDRRLSEIDESFDLLLQATPVNAEAAWREFQGSRFQKTPTFLYRSLTAEPGSLKRRLYDVPVERIEDPTLAHLFLGKQDELDRKITMLADVGTPRFLFGSLQVYGRITPSLLSLAKQLLNEFPAGMRRGPIARTVDARTFAAKAKEEITRYRLLHDEFAATVAIRDDMYSGLLVSHGDLFVGKGTKIAARRVEALLQHEVGTHLVTYYNGKAQPLHQLYTGLAGYDGLQEGLAVLSEYLEGGLDRPRVRLLAARAITVEQLMQGASFVDTFRVLNGEFGFSQRQAYTIAMRVYRAGGLTKDLVYLEGFVQLLEYLRNGGQIEPLLVGKISADHIPIVRELTFRKVLQNPPLRPRYLDKPGVAEKMERIRQGYTIAQLIKDAGK